MSEQQTAPDFELMANDVRIIDAFRGEVILPGDKAYDHARSVWNAAIDRRPAVIARPVDEADVTRALNHARRAGLRVSVRGGGHNVAGSALCDGLVIDLVNMRGIEVDVDARRALVQGGATWGELDAATQAHGLVVPGGIVSETGVAGLTLGGGLGWLRRSLGLSCDQVVAFDVVVADGRLIRADEDDHPALFRALRGGGGGLGVVTAFEFSLNPIGPEVMFSLVSYDAGDGMDVLRAYREYARTVPDEVTTSVILGVTPPAAPFPEAAWGKHFVAFGAMYAGDAAAGQSALAPLATLGGRTPFLDLSGPRQYTAVQRMFDANSPAGRHYYWTSSFLTDVPDEVFRAALGRSAAGPSPASTVAIYQLGGAIDGVHSETSAYAHRGVPFLASVDAGWDPAEGQTEAENVVWARESIRAFAPYSTGDRYLNMQGSAEDGLRPDASAQLVSDVRTTYDADGLFLRALR